MSFQLNNEYGQACPILYNNIVFDTLIQTKLNIPLMRSSLVPRQRLIARLNAGLDGKLTLISAPAGYGKTTLVTEWLHSLTPNGLGEAPGVRVTWLSLDESDNDPRRFLDYLLAALKQIQADIGQTVEAMLQSPQPPPIEALLTPLLNEISALPQSFILILDDYHVIHSPPIHRQLNFLLDHQPQQMHMVLLTREDPPLPLPRLRARGQMTEIRLADLRFSPAECADFLHYVMGLDLPAEDVTTLERRTEGWIAGLQLAALSMRGHDDVSEFIQSFMGTSSFILDYLMEEVFERLSPDVKDFLLKTSVLERMCAPLCDAIISERSLISSKRILDDLQHSNLFIIPLDQSNHWYRFHHLFVELLRQRVQVTEEISTSALHRLASQWYAKEELFPEAVHHALAGADWDCAAELIDGQSVLMLQRGELVTLLGWFKSLPEEVIRARPHLCRDYGWALTLTGQLEEATPLLDCAVRATHGNNEQLGQLLVAQAYLERVRGDYPRAIALSKQALGLIAETDMLHRGLVMFTLGFAFLSLGQFSEAETVLIEACEFTRSSGNDYARLTALGLLGAIQKNQGRLYRGAEFCQQAIQEAHGSPTVAQTQVILSSILYEWNKLEAASEHLTQALQASVYIGNLAIQPEIFRLMAHIKMAEGDFTNALRLESELHQLTKDIESPVLRTTIAALSAELALAQGNIPAASQWAGQMTGAGDPASLGYLVGLTQARLLLAQGKQAEAGKILAGMYESVAKMGFITSMIEVRTMQAIAAASPKEALQFLREALQRGQSECFIRTFVDRGEPLKFLLERLKAEGGDLKTYIHTLLSAFGELAGASKNQSLVEPVSARELEILRLLANGLSNNEIAERLVITLGTAKSHVHHIIEKLEAESRMQAVAKARELGLL